MSGTAGEALLPTLKLTADGIRSYELLANAIGLAVQDTEELPAASMTGR